jgi:hypothetical protein
MASPFDIYFYAIDRWKDYLANRQSAVASAKLDNCAEAFAAAIGGLETEISDQLECFGNTYTEPWHIGIMISTVIESYIYLGMIYTIHELKAPAKDLAESYFSRIRMHMEKAKYLKPN